MKKKILSAAILLFGLTAISVSAQDATTAQTPETEQCTPDCHGKKHKKACKADCKEGKRKDIRAEKHDPFAGLDLTEEQKTQLNAVKEDMKAERKAAAEQAKVEGKDNKDRKDPRARRAEMEKVKADYLAKVKAILTPDQYVTFLENNFLSGIGFDGKHGKFKDDKGGKKHDKGDRKHDKGKGKKDKKGERPAQPEA